MFNWSPTVTSAPGTEPQLRASWAPSTPLVQLNNGTGPAITFAGLTLGPNPDGLGIAFATEGWSREFRLSVDDCVVLGNEAIMGSYNTRHIISIQDSSLGTASAPLSGTAIDLLEPRQNASSQNSISIDNSAVWTQGNCVWVGYQTTGASVHSRITISGSSLRCGNNAIADNPSYQNSYALTRLSLQDSVIVAAGSGFLSVQPIDPVSFIQNTLVVVTSSGVDAVRDLVPSIVNSTFVGGATSLEIDDSNDGPLDVVNNVLVGASNLAVASGDAPRTLLPQYNVFWDNSANASYPLDPSNLTTCDPAFPAPPADPLDPTFDPAVYLPGPVSCLVDAGSPFPGYNDVDGSRNDVGASGGPGGAALLNLFDLDGDGFAGNSDCDDADPLVYAGAPEICGDGLDSDCSGGDAPDADLDGYEDDSDLACPAVTAPDCDDSDPARNPGAIDLPCDGVDQDCSFADEEDFDSDGFLCSSR